MKTVKAWIISRADESMTSRYFYTNRVNCEKDCASYNSIKGGAKCKVIEVEIREVKSHE